MKKLFILIAPIIIFGCSSNQTNVITVPDSPVAKSSSIKPLVITGEEEGWGADIRLSIISTEETDSSSIHKVVSSYKDKNLGLIVIVPKTKGEAKTFGSGLILKSIGAESDNLLQTLAELYKLKPNGSLKFINSISVSYANLQDYAKGLAVQDGRSYEVAGSDYKLFFETEDDYAELYLNINPTEHWIELKEKDEEYRPSLINVLKNK
jgi:hypothetical protein